MLQLKTIKIVIKNGHIFKVIHIIGKYQIVIQKREDAGIKHLNVPKAFIEYSNTMDDVCNNINDCNPNRNRKILILFNDMIVDIMTNKKIQTII